MVLTLWAVIAVAEKLTVFVSVVPQRYFLERIGGANVLVSVLVKPGHSPTTYEPTPRQMAALATADVYVRIGVPFENAWMERIQFFNPNMNVLDTNDGLRLRGVEVGQKLKKQHSRHDHGKDPHTWLSPPLAMQMATKIRDRLIEIDPVHRTAYETNHLLLIADLVQLNKDIKETLANVKNRSFMVFHPAWCYFAEAYGLKQVPIEYEGKEPGPKSLALLIERARALKIKVIFVDPQGSRKQAHTIADAIGGQVIELDPLSENYFENLRNFARLLSLNNS